jgi:hypothetical protein
MKTRILVLAWLVSASCLTAQDSTRTHTLFGMLPFRGAHLDWGGGSVPYLDQAKSGASSAEVRISLPLRKYPNWSIAVSSSAVLETDTTSYVVPESVTPTSTGYHPQLGSTAVIVGLERRWNQKRLVHGIASFGVGTIENSYNYSRTLNGEWTYHRDHRTTTTIAQVGGGAELNIARWLRMTGTIGYRTGGRMRVPQANGSNGGLTSSFNVLLGKF